MMTPTEKKSWAPYQNVTQMSFPTDPEIDGAIWVPDFVNLIAADD